MKKFIFFLIITFSFAKYENLIVNLIGKERYNNYQGFIQTVIKEQNISNIADLVTILKENGLIKLFFEKPQTIHPTFIFINNNPVFNTKTLYKTLHSLGYFYFFPSKIEKKDQYKITLELQSTHYIDPVNFINTIKTHGCNVINIQKNNYYTYTIDCENEFINAPKITSKLQSFLNVKGIYWLNTNNFKKAIIKTSKYDKFHPYIVMYDKNLNILNIISNKNVQKSIKINIPQYCKYIKISDNFTKENIKRGIFIKGIE